MLGTLLEKKLKDLSDKKLLVVMDDEIAFLGTLQEFDKETLVLKDVFQGSTTEVNWSELGEINPEEAGEEGETVVGFIDWTYINMEEVYLRAIHISRIWRWHKKETEKKETKEGKFVSRKPVYRKGHDIANIGSSYDMPERR